MSASEKPRSQHAPYSDEEKRAIVARVACEIAEGKLVKTALAEVGVPRSTLWEWLEADRPMREMYERGRIGQAHAMFEEIIELADKSVPGKAGDVDKVRLQCDSRKFAVAKIAPRIYGEKIELSGANGIPLIPPSATRIDLTRLTTEQLEQYAALHAIATVVIEQTAEPKEAT